MQKQLLDKARRGPFQGGGRSTVLSSSANVQYRKRRDVMEITVRRRASNAELALLRRKLKAHKFSTNGYITFIKGRQRIPIGTLVELDVPRFLSIISAALGDHSTIGIEISGSLGRGTIYKPNIHGVSVQNDVLHQRGIFS